MQIDPQSLIDVLVEQRNEATNELAKSIAYIRQLEEQLSGAHSSGDTSVESDAATD